MDEDLDAPPAEPAYPQAEIKPIETDEDRSFLRVTSFTRSNPTDSHDSLKTESDHRKRMLEKIAEDVGWKLEARKGFSVIAAAVLIAQNIFVFKLVYMAFSYGELDKLQIVLSTLVGATLFETVGVVKIMVEFVFKDIDYRSFKD